MSLIDLDATDRLADTAFKHAAIGQALVRLDGRFIRVNDAFASLVGLKSDEVLDCSFQSLTHPDDLERDLLLLDQLIRGVSPSYSMEKRYLRPDGEIVFARLSVALVRAKDGSPDYLISQVQDRSAEHHARAALLESEQKYRALANAATDVIATYTPQGVFTYVSPAIERVLGYQPAEIVGQSVNALVHPDDLKATWAAFRRHVAAGDDVSPCIAYRGLTKSGETVWLEAHPAVIRDSGGAPVLIQDVIRDVSAGKQVEQALLAARAAAEDAAQAKSDFLANMSHEIRTPLTSILGYAALIAESDDLDEEVADQIDRIAQAGEALLVVVNDILDFSKLEAGGVVIKPRPSDARRVGEEVLALLKPSAETKGVELRFESSDKFPDAVSIDPDRLRQILLNLVGNGLKFTAEGSVTLAMRYSEGELTVDVRDTGPGLAAEACDRLFRRFSQIDSSTSRRHGGTGLGLAICKGLAEAMGGSIGVASEIGFGSTFYVQLPAPTIVEPATEPDVVLDRLAGRAILCVDDNPANRMLIETMLRQFGVLVTMASDGFVALEQTATTRFDAVLMDMRMPGRSGPETARAIRSAPGPNQLTPILAFSAEPAEHCAGPEFDGYVAKPIDLAALLGALAASFDATHQRAAEPV